MEPIPLKKRKVGDGQDDEEMMNCTPSIPSTSIQVVDISFTPPQGPMPTVGIPPQPQLGQMDSKLRELLLSSPAHLFGHQSAVTSSSSSHLPGNNTPQAAVKSWENWLCVLATNLSPAQWQGYWLAHCALFGEQAVPIHMLSFFQGGQISPSSSNSPSSSSMAPQGPHPNDPIHERYEMGNAASGGSSGGGSSRRGQGGGGSGNDFNNSTVFSNGRLAAAETSEFF